LTEPIRDAIRERSVTGMSFRFLSGETVDKWTDRKGDVPLREISSTVVPEMGPVVFPAYAGTEVGVRSEFTADSIVAAIRKYEHENGTAWRDTVEEVITAGAPDAAAELKDLTGQSEARSEDGSDATPTPTQRARTRALSMRKI
jgi:hypothetical protein